MITVFTFMHCILPYFSPREERGFYHTKLFYNRHRAAKNLVYMIVIFPYAYCVKGK